MKILICSQSHEPQVEEVRTRLKQRGITPVIFERYRKDQFVSYQYRKTGVKALLTIDDTDYQLDSKTFPTIWYRPKPIIQGEIPGAPSSIEEKFCIHEWRVILHSLEYFLTESKWINSIQNNQLAANKSYQLKIAQKCGLNIPKTVITNNVDHAQYLFQEGRVIYKTVSSFFSLSHTIYTNEISYDQAMANKEAIAMAPGIFQELIEKDFELRITIVGENIFIARINSQKQKETMVDWRKKPNSDLYTMGYLSDETKNKLFNFHKYLGLIYASYDFAVDKEGKEVFLECNPTGQWLWLKNEDNVQISEFMVNELIN